MRGIGNSGGFKMMIQDKRGRGLQALEAATQDIVGAANQTPGLVGVFSLFNTRTPKIYADIDRVRAEMLGVTADQVFETLEVYVGSAFVNDFNLLGRTYRVTAQADGKFRQDIRDIANLKTRNAAGKMVPIGAVTTFRDITGPYRTRPTNAIDVSTNDTCVEVSTRRGCWRSRATTSTSRESASRYAANRAQQARSRRRNRQRPRSGGLRLRRELQRGRVPGDRTSRCETAFFEYNGQLGFGTKSITACE